MPATQSSRTITWQATRAATCTAGFSIDTNDPLSSARIVPTPTLHLVFGGDAHGDFTLVRAERRQPAGHPPAGPRDEQVDVIPLETRDPEHPQRIELSIDSLPNHLLIEPIPVAIDPLGDNAFTAWVRNLDTNATGGSVVEALLLLKERIAFVYDDLNKRAQLTAEQKTTLQMLHTYIAPKRPDWV